MRLKSGGWIWLAGVGVSGVGMTFSCGGSDRDFGGEMNEGGDRMLEPVSGGTGGDGSEEGPSGGPGASGNRSSNGGEGGSALSDGGNGGRAGEPGSADCSPKSKRCLGNSVQVCDASGAWGEASACPAETPACNGSGVCGQPPSCIGMTKQCGAGVGDSPFQNCCASRTLPGGTFNRSNDQDYPATVSAFRLDTFEVTLARFKAFVTAYQRDMIAAGAGKNPNDPNDTGWNVDWNNELPLNADALKAELACDATYQTWGSADEIQPINCVRWYVANAFCSWDGGRLPTEAEWNYAAAGGDEQRTYPWGTSEPTPVSRTAAYKCDSCAAHTVFVGFSDAGGSRWGQFDLAGNVEEWTLDWYTSPYAQATCTNCANLTGTKAKSLRGGSFWDSAANVSTTVRQQGLTQFFTTGLRCARAP